MSVVTNTTTILDIVRDLQVLDIAPSSCQDQFYALSNGHKIMSWADTVESLGIGPGSHIFFRARVPGGTGAPSSPPSPSPVIPTRKRKVHQQFFFAIHVSPLFVDKDCCYLRGRRRGGKTLL